MTSPCNKSRGQVPLHELAIFASKSSCIDQTVTSPINSNHLKFLGQVPVTCSLILRRPRSFAAPLSLSRLKYSVRGRVHDVRAIINFHQSEQMYHILRSKECMECNSNGKFRVGCAKGLPSFRRGKTVL